MNRAILYTLVLSINLVTNNDNICQSENKSLKEVCAEFNKLNSNILLGHIKKSDAHIEIKYLLPQIKEYYLQHVGKVHYETAWTFPLAGYDSRAIGGVNGNDFVGLGYDYFDGNKHGGHPALDIFIKDINQDCLDDITHKAVAVLSMTPGVVVSCESDWDTTSQLRGGRYIWIYDPRLECLFYYAHNSKIFVGVGDIVKSGDIIAIVGRSGLRAFEKRSPTHLHVMQLKLDSAYYPRPVNCYRALLKAKKRSNILNSPVTDK